MNILINMLASYPVEDNLKSIFEYNKLESNKNLKKNITKYNLFKNLNDQNFNIDSINFESILSDYINNSGNIKNSLISEYIYYLTNTDMSYINSILVKILKTLCNKYKDDIKINISTGNMNLKYIGYIWKKYIMQTNQLYNILWYYNNKFKSDENTMSIINIIRYYLFYYHVVNIKYNNLNLPEIISNYLNNITSSDILSLIDILDMYRCLKNLKEPTKNNVLFNNLNIIVDKLNVSPSLCTSLAQFIDSNIRYSKPDTKYITYKLVLKALYVTKYIENKENLKDNLNKYLCYRLLTLNNNIEFELYVINKINEIYGDKFTNNMTKMIDDIKISKEMNKEYSLLDIQIRSDKYKNISINKEMLSSFNANILKMFVWDNNNHKEILYKMPTEVDVFIEIFNKYYTGRHPDRKLIWKFNMGDSIIAFTGLDKTYNLHLSTVQMIIIMFLNNGGLTLEELVEKSNMNKQLVIHILKGFLSANIIINNNNIYEYNNEFMYSKQNISLIKYMKDMPKIINKPENKLENKPENESVNKPENESENKPEENKSEENKSENSEPSYSDRQLYLSDEIIDYLKNKDLVQDKDLYEYIKQNIHFEYDVNEVNNCLVNFLSKGNIQRIKNGLIIFYKLK